MTGTGSRRRGFTLVVVGLVLGAVVWASPATSHVAGWTHNWVQHIRPKADVRYYTKANANARYYTKAQADARYVPSTAVQSIRHLVTTTPADDLLITVGGNRLHGTCGPGGGSVAYRNETGGTVRMMGPNAWQDVADQTTHSFGAVTSATQVVYTIQVVWNAPAETLTTFTVSWAASGGTCEWLVQAVTDRTS